MPLPNIHGIDNVKSNILKLFGFQININAELNAYTHSASGNEKYIHFGIQYLPCSVKFLMDEISSVKRIDFTHWNINKFSERNEMYKNPPTIIGMRT
jgi:hypothetical protein